MNQIFLTSLSKAINRYLLLDPESADRLKPLENKSIAIEFIPTHFIFYCNFTHQGVKILTKALYPVETKITGTPLQLFNVMITKDNRQHFFADDVIIEGNAEFANLVTKLFDQIEIDWENEFSRFMGDTPAYYANRLLSNIKGWFQKTSDTIADNINEYVHEEALLFPPHEALKTFFVEVDDLRMDVDRIEARINHLKTLIETSDDVTSEGPK